MVSSIDERAADVLGLAREIGAWREQKAAEDAAFTERHKLLVGKVNTEFDLWFDADKLAAFKSWSARLESLSKRIKELDRPTSKEKDNYGRYAHTLASDLERVMLPAFNHPICSVTKVLYDPSSSLEKPRSVLSWGSQAPIIVCGKFGFGLRENVNAKQVAGLAEMQYIIANSAAVIASLRSHKHEEAAKMLEAINELLPGVGLLSFGGHYDSGSMNYPLASPIECVVDSITYGGARHVAGYMGHLFHLKSYRSEFELLATAVSKSHSGRDVVAGVVLSVGIEAHEQDFAERMNFYRLYPHMDGIVEGMEEVVAGLEKVMRAKDVVEELRQSLGRWLLIASI